MLADEGSDVVLEGGDTSIDVTSDLFVGEKRKEALNLIDVAPNSYPAAIGVWPSVMP